MVEAAPGVSTVVRARLLFLLISLYSIVAAWLFRDTITSMVDTWLLSETFTHGFLIMPISLWLVWRKRNELCSDLARPQVTVLLLTAMAGTAWLVAELVDVNIVAQLAFVSVVISGIWAILGYRFTAQFFFPLGFLFLAVPMGEGLIPPLMNFTADTLEYMVRATGIPVYREGTYLSLPTGEWSVVEACSGLRYLIASMTLGLLYAYLSYKSYWRRTAFVIASVLVPIIANSVRAYLVVMIGHLSNMKLATGVDHLLYGWVFFGAVMLLLFWIGGFWREEQMDAEGDDGPAHNLENTGVVAPSALVAVTVLAVAISSLGPVLLWSIGRGDHAIGDSAVLSQPSAVADWTNTSDPGWQWQPKQQLADRKLDAFYDQSGRVVGLLLRQYLWQRPGVELVQGRQTLRGDRKSWRVLEEHSLRVALEAQQAVLELDEAILASARSRLLVWTYYRVNGRYTSDRYYAKLLEAKQKLLTGQRDGTRLFLATPVEEDVELARAALRNFLNSHSHEIERVLDDRGDEAPRGSGAASCQGDVCD